MPGTARTPLGEVRPHRNLRSLYLTYLLIAIWAGVLPWLIPLSLFTAPLIVLAVTVPILLLAILFVWWTGAYYHTILYRFTDDGISWERGVIWRQEGYVPYDWITDVAIVTDPISRLLGISKLVVRTKTIPARPESGGGITISGVTNAEVLREHILGRMTSMETERSEPE